MASNICKGRSSNSLHLISLSRSRFFSTESTSTSPPFKSFLAAKAALLAERNPDKFADLFIAQSTSFPAFARHRPLYSRAVRRLSLLNRDDLIDRILTHQKTAPAAQPLSEGFAIRIISLYSAAGMVDHALRAFNDFFVSCDTKLSASEKSLCALLTVLLKEKMFDKFDDVFENVPKKMSISPGVKSYNLALRAYCERGNLDSAKELISKMEGEFGVVPNIDSFNVVLSSCLKGKNLTGFDELVKEISSKGLVGNLTTYNLRITRLCRGKESARAKKLLDEMSSKGVSPNAASYNVIIDGFCRVGDLESARALVDRMARDGNVQPCSLTYFTLMKNMVGEGEYDLGLEMCKEILRRKWVPPFEAMESLVKGLAGMSRGEDAKEVVGKMKERLEGPAVESWGKIEATLTL